MRKRAFLVAAALLNDDVDPVIQNEDGDDMFDIMRHVYGEMAADLRGFDELREEASAPLLTC